jgi:DNA-binding SARP family transcriptional activator
LYAGDEDARPPQNLYKFFSIIPSMLKIQLLGPPQLSIDHRIISVTRRKSRALVYYLAAQSEPVSREHLLTGPIWSDRLPSKP